MDLRDIVSWRNWLTHLTLNQKIAGSDHCRDSNKFYAIKAEFRSLLNKITFPRTCNGLAYQTSNLRVQVRILAREQNCINLNIIALFQLFFIMFA